MKMMQSKVLKECEGRNQKLTVEKSKQWKGNRGEGKKRKKWGDNEMERKENKNRKKGIVGKQRKLKTKVQPCTD